MHAIPRLEARQLLLDDASPWPLLADNSCMTPCAPQPPSAGGSVHSMHSRVASLMGHVPVVIWDAALRWGAPQPLTPGSLGCQHLGIRLVAAHTQRRMQCHCLLKTRACLHGEADSQHLPDAALWAHLVHRALLMRTCSCQPMCAGCWPPGSRRTAGPPARGWSATAGPEH